MTTKKSLRQTPSSGSELTSLPKVEALPPLKFPTFTELVVLDQATPPMTARKQTDLFDGVLGDVNLLIADYQEHPEKYGEEVHGLLERLTSGTASVKQLAESDRRLLNLAAFDFFQTPPKAKPSTPAAQSTAPIKTKAKATPKKAERPRPRPGIDVPLTELPAYWWLS